MYLGANRRCVPLRLVRPDFSFDIFSLPTKEHFVHTTSIHSFRADLLKTTISGTSKNSYLQRRCQEQPASKLSYFGRVKQVSRERASERRASLRLPK